MKYTLILIALLALPVFAQVETVVYKGTPHYVYPHQEELDIIESIFYSAADSREVLKRDENNRKVISVTVEPIVKSPEYAYYKPSKKEEKLRKQQEKFLLLLLNKKPEMFYTYRESLDIDITPALEPIPDGTYIQYYRDLPYLDGKTIRYRNDVVAGVFTIRNNRLDGDASWYTVEGKLLKNGKYVNGAREGSWFYRQYTPDYSAVPETLQKADEQTVIDYLVSNDLPSDTTTDAYMFRDGLKNGPYTRTTNNRIMISGNYKNDRESGTWDHYSFRIDPNMSMEEWEMWAENKELIRTKHYTIAEKPVRGKSVIIREEVVAEDFLGYNYMYDEETGEEDTSLILYNRQFFTEFEPFSAYYDLLNDATETEGLELPEEGIGSYEGEEYAEPDYSNYETQEYFINDKYYSLNELIDSIGYAFRYDGLYEEFYPNGQLKFRFDVRDGVLQNEDTVFWENGNAANTVFFDADSNHYVQHFFDYKGKLYHTLYFDANGKPLNEELSEEAQGYLIDGLRYYSEHYGNTVEYTNWEGMEAHVSERTLVQAVRWMDDSSFAMTAYLDPATQTLEYTTFTAQHDVFETETAVFGGDYDNVNAVSNVTVGPLRLETTKSGSLYNFGEYPFIGTGDSTNPQRYTIDWQSNYLTTPDDILYNAGKPFTGSFRLTAEGSSYRLSAKAAAISVQLPTTEKEQKLLKKAFRKRKKGKKSPILEVYTMDVSSYIGTRGTFYTLFPNLAGIFSLDSRAYAEQAGYGEYIAYGDDQPKQRKNTEPPFDKTVEGNFLNGKPEGEWIVKDQFGAITARVFFVKGLLDGKASFYATEYPLTKEQVLAREALIAETGTLLLDDVPAEKTHYLVRSGEYKNGILNGDVTEFNWKGDTTSYSRYREGLQEGISFERNKLFYAAARYEDGFLDGISRTYLTLPGRDSILIFDLNFQNGALQGESKSYHTNGKLAKRGFFLTGQPIDDYEAYDTLGVKYQYVKFLYNQPVEEKIWEENQLSVRYLFNWKDSIPFQVSDIAGSSSFERLAVDLGILNDPYSLPYYGRPSLVDKTGIDYNITKYYPNDTVARTGNISKGRKVGHWSYFSYEGKALYEVDYADTIIVVNDSIRFKSKGIFTYLDDKRVPVSKSYIIEKVEKYDCAHTDHNEERMLYTFWERDTSVHRINGYVKNYYDNGAIQNEGRVENGLPTGVWKMYDPNGNLHQVGTYNSGKRDGRWLSGDLGNVKNMTEICLNPNLDNLEEIMAYQEKLLDVSVVYYGMGTVLKREYYGINLNSEEAPENYYGEDAYYGE